MPTKAFEAIVSVTGDVPTDEIAIVEATKHLTYAYAGYIGDTVAVNVYDDEGCVGLHFVTKFQNDGTFKRFMAELRSLERVESVEQVPKHSRK